MKTVLILCFAVTLFYLFSGAESTSPPNCEIFKCSPETCPKVNCACGAYKDYCKCCDVCFKCPGEECITVQNDRCKDDKKCKKADGLEGVDYYNAKGVCP